MWVVREACCGLHSTTEASSVVGRQSKWVPHTWLAQQPAGMARQGQHREHRCRERGSCHEKRRVPDGCSAGQPCHSWASAQPVTRGQSTLVAAAAAVAAQLTSWEGIFSGATVGQPHRRPHVTMHEIAQRQHGSPRGRASSAVLWLGSAHMKAQQARAQWGIVAARLTSWEGIFSSSSMRKGSRLRRAPVPSVRQMRTPAEQSRRAEQGGAEQSRRAEQGGAS